MVTSPIVSFDTSSQVFFSPIRTHCAITYPIQLSCKAGHENWSLFSSSCYIVGLLVVLVTLLSLADTWKEILIPCQNASIDMKACIMPFMMHSAMLPFQQERLYWRCITVSLSFAHNEVSCSNTDFYASIMILAFSGTIFLYYLFIKRIQFLI